jgi:membrane protein implicated in regulation of membrane protease activity
METIAVRRSRRLPLLVALALLAAAAITLVFLLPRLGSEDAALDAPATPPDAAAPPESRGMTDLDGAAMAESGATGTAEALADDIVVRASQEVVVADVAAVARRLTAEVAAAGGRVSAEYTTSAESCPEPLLDGIATQGCPVSPRSTITYRAPLGAVDGLLALTAGLGDESWRTRSATDVGAQVADVDARVASARRSLDRLNALMARAESLTDIIALESQIAGRQAELESLLAQQAQLADQTAMATVTTTLTTATAADDEPSGFWAGLRSGLAALAGAALAGLTVLGWALPFLVLAGLVTVPLLWWWRRRAGRTSGRSAGEPGAGQSGAGQSDAGQSGGEAISVPGPAEEHGRVEP